MSNLADVEQRVERQDADIDTLGGVVDGLVGIVEGLLADDGTLSPEDQATVERIVTRLDGTAVDTEAITARLTALTQSAGGTPTPELESTPAPDEPTVF